MAQDDNILELISQVTEFNDLSEYMKDEGLDTALARVIKLVMKPDIPASAAPRLIVELQALSTKFALLAAYYATIGKGPSGSVNANKKNVFYSTKEALNALVDALKYSARMGT
jgi:hypothetical protein